MTKSAAVLFLVFGCACNGAGAGYAIDFDLTLADGVPQSAIDGLASLRMQVSGAESFDSTVSVAGKFKSRHERLRYKPAATTTGKLDFVFSASTTAVVAVGNVSVDVKPGTYQVVPVTLGAGDLVDLAVPFDLNACGNGTVDPGEDCDPAAAAGCPSSLADCDDHNECTDDSFSGAGCQAKCVHAATTNGGACTVTSGDAGKSGVCLTGQCCTGCIKNGLCKSGDTAAKECGLAGNDCFDCTTNSATATCNSGQCSGCDITSCTNDARTCGTSTCGFNCGSCADGCSGAGVITKYACTGKTCQSNGGGNCGLYATCASGTTCATSCVGDGDCQSNAFCDGAKHCTQKSPKGGPCTAETSGDHECQPPYVCTWGPSGTSGICVQTRCSGCQAGDVTGGCSDYVAYGYDPRNVCPYVNVCQDGVCAGPQDPDDVGNTQAAHCIVAGEGPYHGGKACGTVSCSNDAFGQGTLSGSICVGSVCTAAQSSLCDRAILRSDICFSCAAGNKACNFTAGGNPCN